RCPPALRGQPCGPCSTAAARPAVIAPAAHAFRREACGILRASSSVQAAAPPAPPRTSARGRFAPLFRAELLSPAALRVALPPLALNGTSCLHGKNVEEGSGRRPGIALIPSPEVGRWHARSRTPRPPSSAAPRPRPCKPPSR